MYAILRPICVSCMYMFRADHSGVGVSPWRKPVLLPLAAIGSLARDRALGEFPAILLACSLVWGLQIICRWPYYWESMGTSQQPCPVQKKLSHGSHLDTTCLNTHIRDVFRKRRLALQAMSILKLELLANEIAPHLGIKNLFLLRGHLAFHVSLMLQEDLSFIQGLKRPVRLTRTQRSVTNLSSWLELQVTTWSSSGHWDIGVILLRGWNFPVWLEGLVGEHCLLASSMLIPPSWSTMVRVRCEQPRQAQYRTGEEVTAINSETYHHRSCRKNTKIIAR